MSLTVFFSFVFNELTSLAAAAMFDFLPNAFTFFLVVLNCKNKRHLEMVIVVMLAATLFTVFRGYTALQSGNVASSYLLSQSDDQGQYIMRVRGLAFINDPNDLAQLIVSLIPLLFFFWSKGSASRSRFSSLCRPRCCPACN
jgi:hypothetical protein